MAYGFWSQSKKKEKKRKKHKKQGGEGEHMVERGVRGVCCLNRRQDSMKTDMDTKYGMEDRKPRRRGGRARGGDHRQV